MDELISHLNRNDLSSLYPHDFSEVMGVVYITIRRAVLDGADTLKLTTTRFIWTRGGKQLGEFRIDRPVPTVSYESRLRKILDQDVVIQRYLRVIDDIPDDLVVQFVNDPSDKPHK